MSSPLWPWTPTEEKYVLFIKASEWWTGERSGQCGLVPASRVTHTSSKPLFSSPFDWVPDFYRSFSLPLSFFPDPLSPHTRPSICVPCQWAACMSHVRQTELTSSFIIFNGHEKNCYVRRLMWEKRNSVFSLCWGSVGPTLHRGRSGLSSPDNLG